MPRTVILTDTPLMLRGRLVTPGMPTWSAKDPSEIVACRLDFTPLIGPSAMIVQVDHSADTVQVLRMSWECGVVVLIIGGGRAGTPATVAVSITLADGQRITRAAILPVVMLAPGMADTPNALTLSGFDVTAAGVAITSPPTAE